MIEVPLGSDQASFILNLFLYYYENKCPINDYLKFDKNYNDKYLSKLRMKKRRLSH